MMFQPVICPLMNHIMHMDKTLFSVASVLLAKNYSGT